MKEEIININGIDYVKKADVTKTLTLVDQNIEMPFKVGKSYFFRTVTYHLIGRVKSIVGSFVELEDASWIADSGRFMNAIKEGKLDEVEPVGNMFVNAFSVTDVFPWTHKLPTEQS